MSLPGTKTQRIATAVALAGLLVAVGQMISHEIFNQTVRLVASAVWGS
jgi:hypothetical protein